MAYQDDLRNAILAEAPRLGLSPVDIASIFSYETGGTFDPWKAGPTTQWGQHFGLFQAGAPQRRQYGLTEQMPVGDQVKAFMQYLTDTGVKYGAKLPELYSAVNAGSPDKLLAKDLRGTSVLEKLQNEFPAHREKAINLLRGGAARGVSGAPQQQQVQDDSDPFAGLVAEYRPQQDSGELIMGPYEEAVSDDSTDPNSREFFDGSMATTFLSGRLTGGAAGRKDSVTGFQPTFRQGLAAMIQSAPPGINISINSGYRSQELQDQLYAASLRKHHGNEAEARRWVAKHSRHTLGIAADLKFGDEKSQQWAHANAAKFGLTFRLGHEPWHIESAHTTGGIAAVENPNFDAEIFTDADVGPIMNATDRGIRDIPVDQAYGAISNAGVEKGLIKPYDPNSFIGQISRPIDLLQQVATGNAWNAEGTQPAEGSEPIPDPGSTLDQIEDFGRSTLAATTDLATMWPWLLAAQVTAPGEFIGRELGALANPGVDQDKIWSVTDWLNEQAQKGAATSEWMTGAHERRTAADVSARNAPADILLALGPGGPIAKLAVAEASNAILAYGPAIIDSLREYAFGPAHAAVAPDPLMIVPPPVGVDKAAWQTLGPLVMMSAVLAGFPYAARGAGKLFRFTKANIRDIPGGPSGAIKSAKWRDVVNTMVHDSWHGVNAILSRYEIPKDVLLKVDDVMKINTRSAAKAIATSAVRHGKAETTTRSFNVQVPIARIEKALEDNPRAAQYINMLNLEERLSLPNAPYRLAGMTWQEANRLRRQLERANPEVKELARAYQDHLAEALHFTTRGQWRVRHDIPGGAINRKTYVPMKVEPIDQPNFVPNPATALRVWTEELIVNGLTNEARGTIVNATRQSANPRVRDGAFREVTADELKANAEWKPNITHYRENGKDVAVFSEDFMSDMMHVDPFAIVGQTAQFAHFLKHTFEVFTTGVGYPPFAGVSFIRNWGTALFTTPAGMRGPGLLGPPLAVFQQLVPMAARALAENIEAALLRNEATFWGHPNMRQTSKQLSALLAKASTDSWLARMERYGPHAGTYLDDPMQVMTEYNRTTAGLTNMAQMPGKMGQIGKVLLRTVPAMFRGWSQIMYAVHGAPQFAVTRKNMKRNPRSEWPHVIRQGAELTGNPRQAGQAYVTDRESRNGERRLIRGPGPKIVNKAIGMGTEIARVSIPWSAPITSGMSAMLKAYWRNPIAFTAKLWAYIIGPTIGIYMYNRSLGPEYNKYETEERSELDKATNLYIGRKGVDPVEGWRVPVPQELSWVMTLARTLAHYSVPSMNARGHAIREEDAYWNLAENFLWKVVFPPASAVETALESLRNLSPAVSLLEGDVYARKSEPYDQFGVLPEGLDNFLRNSGGTLAQIFVEALNAFGATTGGLDDAMKNGMEEILKKMQVGVPGGAWLFNAVPGMSTDTEIAKELNLKRGAMAEMAEYWALYGDTLPGGEHEGERPSIDLKDRSGPGGGAVQDFVGDLGLLGQEQGSPSAPYPGMIQPAPSNELYKATMQEIHDMLMTDTKSMDFQGYLSLNKRLTNIVKAERSVKNVGSGHFVDWARLVREEPEIQKAIAGMLPKDKWDPERAANYLQQQRNQLERQLLITVHEIEDLLSARTGREIRLEDLTPHDADATYGNRNARGPVPAQPY